MRPGQEIDVTGLPLHTWRSLSGPEIQPCAECLMTDRLANALMDAGPMVLATIKHGDTARLVRFHSLASPLRALQGPWVRT
jgi:type VI secretion system protein ImpC